MTRATASVLAVVALAVVGCGLAGVGGLDGGLGRATPAHVRDLDAAVRRLRRRLTVRRG